MDRKDEVFLKKLLTIFKVEAGEHIAKISSGLLELEKAPAARQTDIIETVFREAHSMKGAARAVNLADIESLCQSLETVFASLKRKEIAVTPETLDMLHTVVDHLGNLLETGESEPPYSEKKMIHAIIEKLQGKANVPGVGWETDTGQREEMRGEPTEPQQSTRVSSAETTRISKTKLDSILLQAEGLLSVKLAAGERSAGLKEAISEVALLRKQCATAWTETRSFISLLEKDSRFKEWLRKDSNLVRLVEFVRSSDDSIKSLHGRLSVLEKYLEGDRRSFGAMVDGLLDEVKNAAMFPFSSLLEIFPKIVHDLTHAQGKEAELVIRGGDIEIDRRILEEMKDPLIHLVRNCIDHGIEKPEERLKKKKPRSGTVTIAISHISGKKAEIVVSDDGSGIDRVRVRSAAVKAGILSSAEADKLEDKRIIQLIFQSGISTSPIVTDISGRGLGLAIVMEKVEKLGGSMSCESDPGAGTTFGIILPLSLATFRGVLVRVGEHLFVLPTTYLERVVRVRRDEIKTLENRETILLNGRAIPLAPLGAVLHIPRNGESGDEKKFIQAAVLVSAEKHIAISVDEIVNEQEVLVKDLGRHLGRVRKFSGSTVLGSGKVVPVLNVPDLMEAVVKVFSAGKPASVQETPGEKKSILVVEDSITSRTLLKNILVAAGYDVRTAVDGMDAIAALKEGEFDLVVSDVDMPRMNGFDLASKIRSDKKSVELPIVLVTALESREDRERGIDAGANAYIVKSSFDQSNLLEVIQRFI
jgi:two-component system, chemotaxis family, sensor kinase CheA